jgi:hypothetical protein
VCLDGRSMDDCWRWSRSRIQSQPPPPPPPPISGMEERETVGGLQWVGGRMCWFTSSFRPLAQLHLLFDSPLLFSLHPCIFSLSCIPGSLYLNIKWDMRSGLGCTEQQQYTL